MNRGARRRSSVFYGSVVCVAGGCVVCVAGGCVVCVAGGWLAGGCVAGGGLAGGWLVEVCAGCIGEPKITSSLPSRIRTSY